MNLRVTQQTVIQRALADSQRLSAQLATLQTQAATGKRLTNISDDPTASLGILRSSAQDVMIGAHLDNVRGARTALNGGVSALQQVSAVFTQARSIAIEASNSTNDATSLNALASEVDGLLNRLLDLANTEQNDTFIFGGSAAKTKPFAVASSDAQGRPLEVRYQGADEATSAIVGARRQMAIYYPGSELFMARQRQAAVYTGATGATAGAGTDTAIGKTDLRFTHTSTTFAPGSGIQPGIDSAANDTILGPSGRHSVRVIDTSGTGASGTVSLDGGPPFAFTNGDTNLRVTNLQGQVIYLNTTTITANFNGDIDITANGTMSIDGGATSVPLTFDPDQFATSSQTGQTIFVNTTDVERTGTEIVEHPGTYDAFQSLIALRDELRNAHQRTEPEQIQAISRQLGEIQRVHSSVLQKVGEQSASLQSLESLETHLQDMQTAAKSTVSELGDVSVSDVVVKLQAYQQMLELSLATFARINGQSLLDFLN